MNSFGRIFRVSIFGESHGPSVGIMIDGCPSGISLNPSDFEIDLSRRKPSTKGTTKRVEDDVPIIKSGVYKGFTTGSPILIEFENKNIKSNDYDNLQNHFRPGHSDFTAYQKYRGFNDPRGGGHFSGRLTVALVAAGVIAKKIISPIEIDSKIESVGGLCDYNELISEVSNLGDSIGGIVKCSIKNIEVGIGEPYFDSIESTISHLIFSIPAVKGIEFGRGFHSAKMRGSEFNDMIIDENGRTSTNNSGGINGGLSNGNEIYYRVAIKPASSISLEQKTFNHENKQIEDLQITGRHDSAIVLRVPPVIEAASAIAIADLLLINKLYK